MTQRDNSGLARSERAIGVCLLLLFGSAGVGALLTRTARGQIIVSGNENKIELTSGSPRAVAAPEPDSLTVIDFEQFPPKVRHTMGVSNSVVGPPSNLAVTADGRRAILADSLQLDPGATPDPWLPKRDIHWLDLTKDPVQVLMSIQVGRQPSGLSIDSQGRFALVANRADGTISMIDLRGDSMRVSATAVVCPPELSISDVAIHPHGRLALASVQKGGYLAVLHVEDGKMTVADHRLSVYGQPYRVVISPDGELGLTAGQGFAQNGVDTDALSIVDLTATPLRTIGYVEIGAVPESFEVSPDGRLLAAVLMAGSNYPESDVRHTDHGELVLLERSGKTFLLRERHSIGRIPEGVAFTRDGRYLVVQCHPDRELWIFRVDGARVEDTGQRVKVPGMPASLRAAG